MSLSPDEFVRRDALPGSDEEVGRELSTAGELVDRMIAHLLERKLPPVVVGSALLGGAMGVLARDLGCPALLGVLEQAAAAVRSGEFEQDLAQGGRA